MLFDNYHGLIRVAVISVMAYAALVFVLRFAGKRALAKLNAYDLVVTIALGSTLATVLLTRNVAFAEGLLAFFMLALLQWCVARLSIAFPQFRSLIRSQPRLLLSDGQYQHDAMVDERVTASEVDAAIRKAGVGRRERIAAVVLETDGSMSVIEKDDKPSTVLGDVKR
ncbi:DUF421 domain-containing protein [Sphingosinicella sp.]|uniref:DUF421 domain-containing protein n=1 Tax=Sphingosinicella sp. TaxID=1917971 RepID=UPI00262D522D|nr:YetF domain-containing protein [Sphingosinicella sp.]